MITRGTTKKEKRNIIINILSLGVSIGIIFRIILVLNQPNSLNLIGHFSMEFIFQIFLMIFLFRNSSYIQGTFVNWLSKASLISSIGIGLEVTISTFYIVQDLNKFSEIGLEWMVACNLFLICCFIFLSLRSNNSRFIFLLVGLSVGIGLNSIVMGLRSLMDNFNNIDGFFTLLLGLQILFFFLILKLDRDSLEKDQSSPRTPRFENNEPQIAIVVPAHNEERLILRTLSEIPDIVKKIYVIDDGSTDKTADLVTIYAKEKDSRIELIRHEKNKGVGTAIITGYEIAYEDHNDIIVVIGADAQMDMNDLPLLIEPIIENEADYVKGNRFIYGKPLSKGNALREMPKIRVIGNIILSLLTKIGAGYRNTFDSQMGYTAMHHSVFPKINWSKARKGYGYPGDWLARFHVVKIRVKDVPVRAIYLKDEQQTQIKVHKFLFYTSAVLFKVFLFRVYNEYFNINRKSRQRILSQILLFCALLTPLAILISVINPYTGMYLSIIGIQAGIFFFISDLFQDKLSIPSGEIPF